jgi:hypothetical protein
MKSSEIEIYESGPNDGRIMAIQHCGPYPEVLYMTRLPKPSVYYDKNDDPFDLINYEDLRYINSGKMRNGRWIFIRDKTCTRS